MAMLGRKAWRLSKHLQFKETCSNVRMRFFPASFNLWLLYMFSKWVDGLDCLDWFVLTSLLKIDVLQVLIDLDVIWQMELLKWHEKSSSSFSKNGCSGLVLFSWLGFDCRLIGKNRIDPWLKDWSFEKGFKWAKSLPVIGLLQSGCYFVD
jgi:hypothetical protein